MNQIIYIHTISIQRIKDIIIMVSYNYVYTSIITDLTGYWMSNVLGCLSRGALVEKGGETQ